MPSSSTALTPTTLTTPPHIAHGYTQLNAVETFDADAGVWEVECTYEGAWDKRHAFVKDFMPYIDTAGGVLLPKLGAEYVDIPTARAYGSSINGRGKSGLNPITFNIEYERAEVIIRYRTSPHQDLNLPNPNFPDPDQFTFVTEDFHVEIEVLKIPPRSISYTIPSNVPITRTVVNDAYTILLPSIHYTLTQHFVPVPNWQAIDDATGKLNEIDFITPSGRVAIPRTLLYFGPTGSKKYTINEVTAFEMQHDFVYKKLEFGWERKFDENIGQFVDVMIKAFDLATQFFVERKPYATFDHNKIFQSAAQSSGI